MPTTLLALASALTATRRLYQDTSTTNPGVSDTILTELMSDKLAMMLTTIDRRAIIFEGTTGFAAAATNSKSVAGAQQNVVEYQSILRGATVAAGVAMEQWPLYKLLAAQVNDSTTGTPSKYALERVGVGAVAVASTSVGLWKLHIHPIASGAFNFSGFAFYEPPILASGGSLDTPDLTIEQQRTLVRMTAVEAARLLRRPAEFIDRLERLVPTRYQALIGRQPEDASIVAR